MRGNVWPNSFAELHCFPTACENIRFFVNAYLWPIKANTSHVKFREPFPSRHQR